MIVGYHLILTAYGFWLPNDPRGSWSRFVGSWELYQAGGKATPVTERRSHAHDPHDREKRLATKKHLARPPVRFTGIQARAIGRGFARYVEKSNLTVWACAVMPDHVHLAIGQCPISMEQLSIQLKGAATNKLVEEGIHPFQKMKPTDGPPPKCFSVRHWKGYLDPDDVEPTIRYVENNPVKAGLRRQYWPFITAYHPTHL